MNASSAKNEAKGKEPSPSASHTHHPIYVQCEGYRCLAYKDDAGKWRHFHGDTLIKGEVHPVLYAE